ncbi:MAG: PAS domain-containing sensor histidine kinase [Actinomycetota bacterium]
MEITDGVVDERGELLTRLSPDDFGIGVLFDSIADAVIVGDAESERIVLWSRAAEEIFGYAAFEIVGKPIHTLIPERLRGVHRTGLGHYAQSGEGSLIGSRVAADLPGVCKDGREIEIALTLTPVETSSVGGRFALAIIRDITRRRQLEEELRANQLRLQTALDQLRAQEEVRSDFVQMMVHDLRGPTTAVMGLAGLLGSLPESWDEAETADMLERIQSNASHLSRLIDDLLIVAQLEGNELEYVLEPFDLGALVERVVDDCRASAPEHQLEVDIPKSLPSALGDERRQLQILNNLISNAVKFSPSGSVIRASAKRDSDFLAVSVADQGPGIPEKDRATVFERFSRLKQAHRIRGTGLGLFITRRLVEGQQGSIWIDGSGQGTTFTYTIPVAR